VPPVTLFQGRGLWNLRIVGTDAVFERSELNGPVTFYRMGADRRATALGGPARGIPRGVLRGIEDDWFVCLELDGTVALYSMRDGARRVLRQLVPAPVAVAVTPEQIVWCSRDTRGIGGGVHRVMGEVWRWWRGTEDVERLGEHRASRVDLVVAPSPIRTDAMSADVYVAAEQQLGVVDLDGLRWLAHEEQGVRNLVCTRERLYYTTHSRVVELDLATGKRSTVWRESIPMALAIAGRRCIVSRNYVASRDRYAEQSALTVVDLDTREAAVIATDIGTPRELAVDDRGIYVICEPDIHHLSDPCRLVFVAWNERTVPVPWMPRDPVLWSSDLVITMAFSDGVRGVVAVHADGKWDMAYPERRSGTIAEHVREATLGELEDWFEDWRYRANGLIQVRTG
jgi:hypothetical protein